MMDAQGQPGWEVALRRFVKIVPWVVAGMGLLLWLVTIGVDPGSLVLIHYGALLAFGLGITAGVIQLVPARWLHITWTGGAIIALGLLWFWARNDTYKSQWTNEVSGMTIKYSDVCYRWGESRILYRQYWCYRDGEMTFSAQGPMSESNKSRPTLDNWNEDCVQHHLEILADAGLVDHLKSKISSDAVWGNATFESFRLTWAGHEFLDASRSDTAWKKATDFVIKTTGGLLFDVLFHVLKRQAMEAAGITE